MALVRILITLFLLPGTLVLKRLGISIESDGGIFRSFINMMFWGVIGVFTVLIFTMR